VNPLARSEIAQRNRAAELGVDLYLGKPFQEDELFAICAK